MDRRLARRARPDDGHAFLPDPLEDGVPASTDDDLAEALAEEFVMAATSAEEVTEDVRDGVVTEELGGPFIEVDLEPRAKKKSA